MPASVAAASTISSTACLPRRRKAFMSPPDGRPPDAASRSWTWSFSSRPRRAALPSASYRTNRIVVPPCAAACSWSVHLARAGRRPSVAIVRSVHSRQPPRRGGSPRATWAADPAGLLQRVRGLGAGRRDPPRHRDLPAGGARGASIRSGSASTSRPSGAASRSRSTASRSRRPSRRSCPASRSGSASSTRHSAIQH